jgi:hypothetical protein
MRITQQYIDDLVEFYEIKHLPLEGNVLLLPEGSEIPDEVKEYALSKGLRIIIDVRPEHEFNMDIVYLPSISKTPHRGECL